MTEADALALKQIIAARDIDRLLPLLEALPRDETRWHVEPRWLGGKSPLGLAIETKDVRIVDLLLEFGCDPNERAVYGGPPIYRALGRDQVEMVRSLIAAGAQIENDDIHALLEVRSVAMFDLLLRHGADPRAIGPDGENAIHRMIFSVNAAELIPLFLKYGVDINGKVNHGATPLREALGEHVDVGCAVVLDHGASLDGVVEDEELFQYLVDCLEGIERHDLVARVKQARLDWLQQDTSS